MYSFFIGQMKNKFVLNLKHKYDSKMTRWKRQKKYFQFIQNLCKNNYIYIVDQLLVMQKLRCIYSDMTTEWRHTHTIFLYACELWIGLYQVYIGKKKIWATEMKWFWNLWGILYKDQIINKGVKNKIR